MSELAEYIADHYGTCTSDVCTCLKNGWLGRKCPRWTPVSAKNWVELGKEMGKDAL